MNVKNARGPIADSYHVLQSLGLLEAACQQTPVERTTPASRLRCVLQAVEIAFLNLTDLLSRATSDLHSGAIGAASVKVSWMLGFHRVLSWLGHVPHRLPCSAGKPAGRLRLIDSPAHSAFFRAFLDFDAELLRVYGPKRDIVIDVVANRSLDHTEARLFLFLSICNREAVAWEQSLAELPAPVPIGSYSDFIGADWIRSAVEEMRLQGDTFMTQFRGLHQIPEVLAAESAALVESGVRDACAGRMPRAANGILDAVALFAGSLPCMIAMVDNLSPADYHQIRENLGQTSGSHSVTLHHHLFHDLYQELGSTVTKILSDAAPNADLAECARQLFEFRNESCESSVTHAFILASLELRCQIATWRELHLNLPRNMLGGRATRSLIGSTDAVAAVRRLRDVAMLTDPLNRVARAFGLPSGMIEDERTSLAAYLDRPDSADTFLQHVIGAVTQARFPQVQAREGVFAERCPYAPPAPRNVDQ